MLSVAANTQTRESYLIRKTLNYSSRYTCCLLYSPTTWPTPSNKQPSLRELKQTEGRDNKQPTKKANTSASESNAQQWSTTVKRVHRGTINVRRIKQLRDFLEERGRIVSNDDYV